MLFLVQRKPGAAECGAICNQPSVCLLTLLLVCLHRLQQLNCFCCVLQQSSTAVICKARLPRLSYGERCGNMFLWMTAFLTSILLVSCNMPAAVAVYRVDAMHACSVAVAVLNVESGCLATANTVA